jgi:hypothetical protein
MPCNSSKEKGSNGVVTEVTNGSYSEPRSAKRKETLSKSFRCYPAAARLSLMALMD